MTQQLTFGGEWTEVKLKCLHGYLEAYMNILSQQSWAKTIYVDAFAGTGRIPVKTNSEMKEDEQADLFSQSNISEIKESILAVKESEQDELVVKRFLNGSARVAISIRKPFDEYLFIDQKASNAKELQELKTEFPHIASRIQVVQAEANDYMMKWVKGMGRNDRAVVFLDPFGMQVNWDLLKAIAGTKRIDLWLLVPIGMGVNRMMTNKDLPPQEWSERLTRFFGSEEWQERFYKPVRQPDLFGDGPTHEKNANYEELSSYFVERLRSIFGHDGVAPNPLTQRNSRNSPMFLLCFASTNKTGIKIAHWLLENRPKAPKGRS